MTDTKRSEYSGQEGGKTNLTLTPKPETRTKPVGCSQETIYITGT